MLKLILVATLTLTISIFAKADEGTEANFTACVLAIKLNEKSLITETYPGYEYTRSAVKSADVLSGTEGRIVLNVSLIRAERFYSIGTVTVIVDDYSSGAACEYHLLSTQE